MFALAPMTLNSINWYNRTWLNIAIKQHIHNNLLLIHPSEIVMSSFDVLKKEASETRRSGKSSHIALNHWVFAIINCLIRSDVGPLLLSAIRQVSIAPVRIRTPANKQGRLSE